jgi:hypothetical protein
VAFGTILIPTMFEKLLLIAALCATTVASVSAVLFLTRRRTERPHPTALQLDGSPYRAPARRAPVRNRPADEPRWWGRHGLVADAMVILSLASAAALFSLLGAGEEDSSVRRWAFTQETTTGALGLAVTAEHAGVWRLERDPRATGARALVNHVGTPGSSPALAIAPETLERDVRVRTRCRVRASGESLACGVVFRHRDPTNYYSARVDARRQEVVLSVVAAGKERIIARAPARLEVDVWQEVTVDARGDRIRVSWNDETAIETTDSTHVAGGSIGLWTAATTAAHFDELWLERLPRDTLRWLGPGALLPSPAG